MTGERTLAPLRHQGREVALVETVGVRQHAMNFPRSAVRAGGPDVAADLGGNVKGDRPHANPLLIRVAIIIFKREVAHIPPRCVEASVKVANFTPGRS